MEVKDRVRRWLGQRARMTTGAALAIAVTASALAATPAQAFHDQGRPWPGHVITYHSDFPGDAAALRAAVHDWNTSGADLRFVPATAARAEVTIMAMRVIPLASIEHTRGGGSADALGYATVGAVPHSAAIRSPSGRVAHGAHVWLARIGARDRYGIKLSLGTIERVAVHELGHILGLGHEHRACAVMQPILNDGCGIKHPWTGLCNDPLEPDDIRGAVSLYGGHEPAFRKRLCTISQRPGPPRTVSVELSDGRAALRWRNPPGVTLRIGHLIDPYALDGRATVEDYEIQGSRSGCPAGRRDVLEREPAHAGARMQASLALLPGSWCLRVRVIDVFGRLGPGVTLRAVVPAPGQASPPAANFQLVPAQPAAGQSIAFEDESTAGSAAITGWSWGFGDGTGSAQQDPRHSYANPGSYTVTLLVTGGDGQSASVSEQVNVA